MSTIAVLGAGTMGHGIAHVAGASGFRTILFDVDAEALDRGLAHIAKNLDRGIEKGKLSDAEKATALGNITTSTDLADAVGEADLVIEAIPERMDLKSKVFADLNRFTPESAILATNTSSLSVTEIAAASGRADRVIGMHFFNPPHLLKLLEIVVAEQTSDATLEQTKVIAEELGRERIVVGDSPGFATSRLGLVIGLEAMRMLQEGVASAEDIDRAMTLGYRHPVGPLKLTDMVGLDVRLAIADYLHKELGGEQFRAPPILRRMVRAGKLGKKSGQGFYEW